jgi:hypothetical protein
MSAQSALNEIVNLPALSRIPPCGPGTPEEKALREFAKRGGKLHNELMTFLPYDKIHTLEDLHREATELVKESMKLSPFNTSSESALLEILGLLMIRDTAVVSERLAMLANSVEADEKIHPLVLLALSVGKASLENAAASAARHIGSEGAPAGIEIATIHVDIVTTIVVGLFNIPAGLICGASASLGVLLSASR